MGSVRQRGKTFTAYWRDRDGRQVTKGGFLTRKAAEQAWKDAEAKVRLGVIEVERQAVTGPRSVTAWSETWLAGHRLSGKARESYQSALKKWILPSLGSKNLARVTRQDVEAMVRDMEDKNASPILISKVLSVARTMFETAVPEHIASNPAKDVKGPRVPQKIRRIISPDQFGVLLAEIPENYRLLVSTAIETGCRWGELTELRGKDLRGNALHVSRSVQRLVGKGQVVKGTKSDADRIVHITPQLATALRNLGRDDEELFFSDDGSHIVRTSFHNAVWLKATRNAGLPGVTFHDLRHAHASWLLRGGATLAVVKERLGHTDISTTSRYLSTLPDAGDEALAAFKAVAG